MRRIRERQGFPKTHFYATSGGNAGIACVHAAKMLGYPATVVVPNTAKPAMIEKLWAMGAANVIQYGENVLAADKYLKTVVLAKDPDGVYVPPFDHPDIWEGNATVMEEVIEQLKGERPEAVVCSVGGGGLFNGIIHALDEKKGSKDTTVIAMETEGADSLNRSLIAGELITLDRITSQATSLGVSKVCQKTFELAQRPQVKSAVLPDSKAARGCWLLAKHERMMVELTAGVNVALCYDGLLEKVLGYPLAKDSKVVIIVCGGNDISVDMLVGWREFCGDMTAIQKPAVALEMPPSSAQVVA